MECIASRLREPDTGPVPGYVSRAADTISRGISSLTVFRVGAAVGWLVPSASR